MSELLVTLRNARQLFLDGKHQFAGMVLLPDLLFEAAGKNTELVDEALAALDAATPRPWTFSLFIDGAEWAQTPEEMPDPSDFLGVTYRYDRKPEEIAAVFGRACARAAKEAA